MRERSRVGRSGPSGLQSRQRFFTGRIMGCFRRMTAIGAKRPIVEIKGSTTRSEVVGHPRRAMQKGACISQAAIQVLDRDFVIGRTRSVRSLDRREVVADPGEPLVDVQSSPRNSRRVDLACIGGVSERGRRLGWTQTLSASSPMIRNAMSTFCPADKVLNSAGALLKNRAALPAVPASMTAMLAN